DWSSDVCSSDLPSGSACTAAAVWVTSWTPCGSILRIKRHTRVARRQAMSSIYDQDLPRTAANFSAISPLSFIERSARVYPNLPAIVHGSGEATIRRTWSETYRRCRQLADALSRRGVGKGDTVAVLLPNTPPMVEAHFGVPMTGAVLNTINTRLDPQTVAFILDHGEAGTLIVDAEFASVARKAIELRQSKTPLQVIDVHDPIYDGPADSVGDI